MRGLALVSLLLLSGLVMGAESDPQTLIAPCLECHDNGEDTPAHQVLLGSHGIEGEAEDVADRRGCLDCHGDSTDHIASPRGRAPDVSFGPRWTATPGAQDKPCLACHEENTAKNWRNALHMVNNMTCVTCHNIHDPVDSVLVADQQTRVCTTCHKAQKSGIHDLGEKGPDNPPCSLCHNPHDHETAAPHMLANQSAGCAFCHSTDQMDTLAALNPRAGNFHKAASSGSRSCIDCHQDITHAPEESAPPLHPNPVRGRQVTLFYPGNANRQWLLREHPGSQPLRQGTDCERCHRGDEAQMGAALAGDLSPSSRPVGIAFSRSGEQLQIDLNWEGPADDARISLMWGATDNREFRVGGCFAACHGGEPGQATRLLYHGGSDSDAATMGGLVTAGQGVELWRVSLASGELTATRGSDGAGQPLEKRIVVNKQYRDGLWSVNLQIDLKQSSEGVSFSAHDRYTFGIALHGAAGPGREHWVSLPQTMSFSGHSTDFTTE